MAGPAEAAGGDGDRQIIVERPGQQTEVLDVVLLVFGEKVVGGHTKDRAKTPAGQPANERDRVDTDVVKLAFRFDQLMALGRVLFLAATAELGGPVASLGKKDVGVDSEEAPKTFTFD